MSFDDEDYQHGLLINIVRDLLRTKVGITQDEALIQEIVAPLEVTPFSEVTRLGQNELMTRVLQNHPELLAKWKTYWAGLPLRDLEVNLGIIPGLVLAPGGFRPLDNPNQWLDSLKALVAPSFFEKTDKDGKKSYEIRSFGIVPRN